MNEQKRLRARAIIYNDGKIVSMYREKPDRIYYTFPGGGMNPGESEQDCVIREVEEEFGLKVQPIKKVYTYENQISVEHFYICKWISGEFGSGEGEEFEKNNPKGVYKPMFIEIEQIPNLPLMPPEVASEFVADYKAYGEQLCDNVKYISGDIK